MTQLHCKNITSGVKKACREKRRLRSEATAVAGRRQVSYGRDIGKGTQVLSMLAWRTASLLYRRLLIVALNLRRKREWREG